LQDGVQHTIYGSEGPTLTFAEAADAIELAKQLICAIYQVNDHMAV
jgi:hypothetical protein